MADFELKGFITTWTLIKRSYDKDDRNYIIVGTLQELYLFGTHAKLQIFSFKTNFREI